MKSTIINDRARIDQHIARLRIESRKIVIRDNLFETNGMVIDFDEQSFTVVYQGIFKPASDNLNMQFMVEGDYYFGFVSLVSLGEQRLVLSKPQELEKRSARKYPRTFVSGEVFARFNIISDVSAEREMNPSGAPPKLAKIYFELQKNVPDIKRVLMMIGEEIKDISPLSRIVLHKEGDRQGEETELVEKYKKPFWIPDTDDLKLYIRDVPDNDIINFSSYFAEMKRTGWADSRIREELLKRQQQYAAQEYRSLAVVPIMLYANVIGHISVVTTRQTARLLRISDVYYVKALADIASEALAKARLFRLDTGTEYEIPVVNVSAGGTYLEVNSPYIIKFLHENMHLKVELKFSGKETAAIAEIRRIDFLGEAVRLALKFIEISTVDQEFIEEFVRRHIEFNRNYRRGQPAN